MGKISKEILCELKNLQQENDSLEALFNKYLSEYNRIEKALRECQKNHRILIDNIDQIVYTLDVSGAFTFISPNIEDQCGLSPSQIYGSFFIDFVHSDYKNTFKEQFSRLLLGKSYQSKYPIVIKGDKFVWMRNNAKPILEGGKRIIGVQGVLTDITDCIRVEQQLHRTRQKAEESSRLKKTFLANLNHEIRTPMNGIIGFAELLKEDRLKSRSRKKYIEFIRESGKQMLDIINNLVEISNIEAGEVKLIKTQTCINEQIMYVYKLFKSFALKKGIDLRSKIVLTKVSH